MASGARPANHASVTPLMTADVQWLALSDHAGPLSAADGADLVQCGSLVLEFSRPRDSAAVLLDYQLDTGWARAISIFQERDAGIVLRHRQGAITQRLCLPGPLPQDWNRARLTYNWNGPARHWSMVLEDTDGRWSLAAHGIDPMPLAAADLLAVCAGPHMARRHPSLDWFGVCLAAPVCPPANWIGARTPVDTQRGRIAACDLRVGDFVATRDSGAQALRGLRRMVLPNRGRLAPVLLRAPYFGRQVDLLVAQRQLILMSGTAVEYLFGEDAVLAPAAALCDGNSALPDTRRPLADTINLDFGATHLILANGCPLLCAADGAPLPYRLLHDYETKPLQSLLGRVGQRSAA